VVIPAFDEERRLGSTLTRIVSWLERAGLDAEILVVDDGSRDATAREAVDGLRGRRGRVLRNVENRGKGYSVRKGVLAARGRWILVTDADLCTPIEEYEALAQVTRDRDVDVVIGSRGLPGSRVEVGQHVVRRMLGKIYNRLMRLMTGLRFRDTQCGFKLMDRERVRPLFERMVVDGFACDVELLFLCDRFGLACVEAPVVWRDSPGSRVRLVTDSLNMLADIVRVRWRFRRGRYNPGPAPSTAP
jgi:dolichyl-phosphate beta-glucosyltransferase